MSLFMGLYFLLVVICRVSCTISRGVTLHISFVWFRRASSGIPVYIYVYPSVLSPVENVVCWTCSAHGFLILYLLLVQAFARLSAVYGGTYMLNKPECKVDIIIPCYRYIRTRSLPPPLSLVLF